MKEWMSEADQKWAEEIYQKLVIKLKAECNRIGGKIPYIAKNGIYQEDKSETDITWWTNGFWAGMMWQMYHAAGDEQYREAAEEVEKKLDQAFDVYTGLHHDVGFMWLHSAVADYRLTGSERSLARGLHAAHLLAGRYNPRGKFLRSWNKDRPGWVIVDSMMNIPLLYWAAEVTGDPRFRYIAMDHADTVMQYTVRGDGSCNHIIVLNPENGELLDTPGGQGYGCGSAWSRGQAWAIYGFALSYRHTERPEYLATAKKVAHYFMAQTDATEGVALLDFRAPAEPVYWDSTAGVCAACGMLEIASHVQDLERSFYVNGAMRILKATDRKFCNWDDQYDSIVQMGSGSYMTEYDRHVPIIYGDYFLMEAVLKLLGKGFLIW
ncbi:glycosyl hydrolase family 88 [Clostridium sp. MCC353]|uniref:glycoside hydrolase family 88 protein n=1 Tax=Clostridium sp. MCC353 TaxID=2592646 RepID=UPI001C02216E|nr:glycoside hydrolase family 88 protein [Clostridium sp. MCC353]MBT9776595.1 glycosyl hydrolase family 88 [Clostridium sp. MCC353]